MNKARILTGDTPTGRLHLGHWVGSLENRVQLQDDYDCFFIIANAHAFTTRAKNPDKIRQSVLEIMLDYLAAGIDPNRSTIFLQTEVPAIAELCFLFSMLLPYPRVMRNPTLKAEIRDKELGENYSFGFLLYAVGQVADILAFRPELVPVGEDQLPHLEMTREVARRFNQYYCGVSSHVSDNEVISAGGLFPVIEAKLGRTARLPGLSGPNAQGQLLKMSKSLNNAIFLSDDNDTISKKVMNMYTDPNRLRASDPGTIENNPLWIFHDTFNADKDWVEKTKVLYQRGEIGDVICKRKLTEVLINLIEPMRIRRSKYEKDPMYVLEVLKEGTRKANIEAEKTLYLAKTAMKQDFMERQLVIE